MKLEQVKKLTTSQRFLYWITERQSIFEKRQALQEAPWTDDTILQSYRFCNVRRIDDRVSQWLMENWYSTSKANKHKLKAAIIARTFNLPECLEEIREVVFSDIWQPRYLCDILRKRKERGDKLFNGAYMVRGVEGMDKSEMVIRMMVHPVLSPTLLKLDTTSVRRSVEKLKQYWGFSDFLAGQVVADLRWTMKGTWSDRNIWAAMGPGSKRGMNRLLNCPLHAPWTQIGFIQNLTEKVIDKYKHQTGVPHNMEAIDWQNCLCEFDKYERALWGQGRPKQKFNGRR